MIGRFGPANAMFTAPGPSLLPPPPPTLIERVHGLLTTKTAKIVEAWFAVQLPHYGGKYSVERLLALEEYTRTTPLCRVILVTIGVPLLVLALVLCQESIPLQDPTDGWEVNYGFWFRAGLVGVSLGNAASIQIGFWLDVPPFSLKQILGYCVLMGSGYIAAGMITARFWVFPIPFFMFTMCLVTATVIVVYIRLVVGVQGFRQILSKGKQLRRLRNVGMVQALMYIVYPAYQILFTKANHSKYEFPVLMIRLVIQLVLKWMFAAAAAHKEDMVPVQVVFTVDFFDAFYFASFIQSVSYRSLAAVMCTGLLQTASELFELHHRRLRIISRLSQVPGMTPSHGNNILAAVRELCSNVDTLGIRIHKSIQLRSCVYHQLTGDGRALLSKLERYACAESRLNSYQHNLKTVSRTFAGPIIPEDDNVRNTAWMKWCPRGKVAVEPPAMTPNFRLSPKKEDIPATSSRKSSKTTTRRQSVVNVSVILKEAVEVLFTLECLVLSEYMEVFVPAVYGIFVLAMIQLPSAKYHTELAGIGSDNEGGIVLRIFAYALMELGSFIVLAVLKKRSCGISALYQLAFVLETQTLFVQSTLMMWILLTLTYRVVHFGCDFTFQFKWI